jgi:hypothetical protein
MIAEITLNRDFRQLWLAAGTFFAARGCGSNRPSPGRSARPRRATGPAIVLQRFRIRDPIGQLAITVEASVSTTRDPYSPCRPDESRRPALSQELTALGHELLTTRHERLHTGWPALPATVAAAFAATAALPLALVCSALSAAAASLASLFTPAQQHPPPSPVSLRALANGRPRRAFRALRSCPRGRPV